MKLPDEIKKCAAFIGYKNYKLNIFEPVGTVFFMGINPRKLNNPNVYDMYVVTAAHVINNLIAKGVEEVLIRINTKNGGTRDIVTNTSDWKLNSTKSQSQFYDIAVFTGTEISQIDGDDSLLIPPNIILNSSQLKEYEIAEGDEVFFIGFFKENFSDNQQISPIPRFGKICRMPLEKSTSSTTYENCFLIEAMSVGGFYGSPVFVDLRGVRFTSKGLSVGAGEIRLIGLLNGHWDETAQNQDNKNIKFNKGIAIVTPIDEVINFIRTLL